MKGGGGAWCGCGGVALVARPALVLVLVLVFGGIVAEEAGTSVLAQDRSCLNELAPCLNYLNGTRHPPDNCCDPLKSVIKSNPKCLCSMISNQGTSKAEQAGINVNEAQQLPARCGQRVNPLSCLSTKGNSPTSSRNSLPNSANIPASRAPTAFSLSVQIILLIGIRYINIY